jgi:hypothetical protein
MLRADTTMHRSKQRLPLRVPYLCKRRKFLYGLFELDWPMSNDIVNVNYSGSVE